MTELSMQRDLCARIAHTLATAPIHDHLGYEALAYLKLPGPDYRALLRCLHLALAPKTYVEIGVRGGDTLSLARPDTWVAGIDPKLAVNPPENGALYVTTSDEFFASQQRADRIRGFDLAFIDGDHSFAQGLRDFENLEACAGPNSIIAIHDVIPMDEVTSAPACQSSFWTGDVWKLMAAIVATRRDLVACTVACPPTGLGLVGHFGAKVPRMSPVAIAAWSNTALDMDWAVLTDRLNIVPNEAASILAALTKQEAA